MKMATIRSALSWILTSSRAISTSHNTVTVPITAPTCIFLWETVFMGSYHPHAMRLMKKPLLSNHPRTQPPTHPISHPISSISHPRVSAAMKNNLTLASCKHFQHVANSKFNTANMCWSYKFIHVCMLHVLQFCHICLFVNQMASCIFKLTILLICCVLLSSFLASKLTELLGTTL